MKQSKNSATKYPITTEEDKFRKEEGRMASEMDKDSEFLDAQALDDDIVDIDDEPSEDDASIVNSKHPENQEWHAREIANERAHKHQ
jgi:hypothetical protein